MTRSYPNRRWRPPMLGIDHVLVHNCVATSARTVVVPESDHRGLLVTVDVPLDPTASSVFDNIPLEHWEWGYPAVMTATLCVCLVLYYNFRRSRWL